ncbi:mitochondrial F1F0-ATP synthase-like protein g subunit [Clohesyomyces aquaticus]|uniref:Mitochondrial F1F0-ATP synthase-like protein g subunit n=1 Tax=Clohesyomyces aquaticus TaxID=1231657 RepID=A0A1Y1ZV86_9PLEO|nr:mitochondrial F1F0-ATP synthase-like protein g subunit [Clohesyomyces aquaticus]
MSLAASRAVLRHSKFAARRAGIRNASSTSEAAAAAKEKAQSQAANLQAKATEGLSKVASSAGATLSKVGSATADTLGNVGGRTGRVIGGLQSLIPSVVYYSKVGLELGKLVAHQRKMSPPDLATFQSYFQPILNNLRNPNALLTQTSSTISTIQPANLINRVRDLSTEQWAANGVIAAEVLGFFTVGTMIGRFKIVGYRSKAPAHH